MAFCAFGSAGDAYVFVVGPHQPTEYEWNAYLTDLARFGDEPFGLMVLADCGLPDMRQAAAFQVVADASVDRLTAVISSEMEVRDTVEVIDWLGANVRWFPPSGIMAAMDFIRVPRNRVGAVWSGARALERLVEGGRVNAVALADPFVRATESPALHHQQ
jgi:hypothetical protein